MVGTKARAIGKRAAYSSLAYFIGVDFKFPSRTLQLGGVHGQNQ